MIILRPARDDDALPLLEWQRHPDTRRYARNTAVPERDQHLAWFNRKIADPNCRFMFAVNDALRVGMLRLDKHEHEWELSIIVAPELRRRRLGLAMLAALRDLPPPGPLVAEVLPGNEVSHRLFQSAKWRRCDDGLYRLP